MPQYLLSSQSVLDILKRQNLPAERWLEAASARGISKADICISAVTPMSVLSTIDAWLDDAKASKRATEPSVESLQILRNNAQKFIRLMQDGERIVPMCHHIAERWGWLLDMEIPYRDDDDQIYQVGSVLKIELATAAVGRDNIPFVYVDRTQEAHKHISNLVTEDPEKFRPSTDK